MARGSIHPTFLAVRCLDSGRRVCDSNGLVHVRFSGQDENSAAFLHRVGARVPLLVSKAPTADPVVLVENVEQLRVRVVPLLARVRVRRVHVGRDRVGHDLRSAPCSAQSGIGLLKSFPTTPWRLAVAGPIKMPEHVVERAVLEQHNDDVVERIRSLMSRHDAELTTTVLEAAGSAGLVGAFSARYVSQYANAVMLPATLL